MKPVARATAVAVASVLALAACQKPADKPAATSEAAKGTDASGKSQYPGLPTEKEQISYTIGLAMGKQLTEIKDEINVDTVVKAMRAQLAGEKVLLTEDQAKAIFESFGQKMQAKQIAKMMADVGYRGYIVLEYEEKPDPRTECPKFIAQLREAFLAVS